MDISRLKSPLLVATVGLALGFGSDLLLYDKPVGISFPIIMVAILVALVVLGIVEKGRVTWANLGLGIPLVYLAIMSAVRAEPFLRFLNVSGALILLALLADRLVTGPLTTLNLGNYLVSLFQTGLYSSLIAPSLLKRAATDVRAQSEGGKTMRRVLVGVLIAAPFLCIFTVLFAAADLLFNVYLDDLLGDLTLGDVVGHALLTAALAWIVMGGLAYALTRSEKKAEADDEPAEDKPAKGFNVRGALGTLEASIALYSIDVLFLVFVGIQFAALFGGEAFLERHDLTYSEYARQGFFELLTVALITLALLLALDFVTRRESPRQRLTFLLGSGLMIALTIVILVSAFQRLRLYELAFGFTRLRLQAHVFMVWLAILLAFFMVALLVRQTRLFATGALLAAIGFTATLNVINPDAFIVAHNIKRYEDDPTADTLSDTTPRAGQQVGEGLDVDYLGGLSADAVPHLMPLLTDYDQEFADEIGPWLHTQLDRADARQARAGWPSTHLSMSRAYQVLDTERELIEDFEPVYGYWWD